MSVVTTHSSAQTRPLAHPGVIVPPPVPAADAPPAPPPVDAPPAPDVPPRGAPAAPTYRPQTALRPRPVSHRLLSTRPSRLPRPCFPRRRGRCRLRPAPSRPAERASVLRLSPPPPRRGRLVARGRDPSSRGECDESATLVVDSMNRTSVAEMPDGAGWVTVLVSRVTAVCARSLPAIDAPVAG